MTSRGAVAVTDPRPRAAIYGTGQLAREILRTCRGSNIPVVAAISHNPANQGRDFGTLTIDEPIGVAIDRDLASAASRSPIDVLLYAGLGGEVMLEICRACVAAGIDFITSSGLFHPVVHLGREAADRLEEQARRTGAHVLGTGINPGFVADILPVLLASASPDPVSIEVRRVSDITPWGRLALSEESNIGKSPEAGVSKVVVRHMIESVHVIAAAIGLKLDNTQARSAPLIADAPRLVAGIEVASGCILGFEHRVSGLVHGIDRIVLEWLALPGDDAAAAAAARPPRIRITGPRGLVVEGNIALPYDPYPGTAARMVKSVIPLRQTPAGLRRADELSLAYGPRVSR